MCVCACVCVCVCEEKNMRLSVRGNLRTCIDEATNFSGSKFFFSCYFHIPTDLLLQVL